MRMLRLLFKGEMGIGESGLETEKRENGASTTSLNDRGDNSQAERIGVSLGILFLSYVIVTFPSVSAPGNHSTLSTRC